MSFVNFHNIECTVNTSGVLAESATIQTSNGLEALYALGQRGSFNHAPKEGIKTTFQISYFPEVDREPNYQISSMLRGLNNDVLWEGVTIIIGGVTGYNCYLENYGLSSSPNEPVKANVSFVSFVPVSGDIKSRTVGVNYNDRTGISHGWTTYLLSTGMSAATFTYEFSYDFNASWQPTYILGRKTPLQVNLMNGSEKFSFVRNKFYQATFSGLEAASNYFETTPSDTTINLYPLSFLCSNTGENEFLPSPLSFNISGAKITDCSLNASINDFAKTTTTIEKYF